MKDFLFKLIIAKNAQFKNVYKGESCYIFGNGASIKSLDLNDFNDLHSISINLMNLHKDFEKLNSCGYVLPESYFFYRYFINPYDKKIKENIIGNLFRTKIRQFPDLKLFTSVTNFFGAPTRNTFFFHHFEKKLPDKKFVDLAHEFSFIAGGLYAAIGLAIYFGFHKIILVGCDYFFSPREYGHFYSLPSKSSKLDYSNPYPQLILQSKELIDIEILCLDNSSDWLKNIKYTNFCSKPLKYKENHEIVDNYSLSEMHRAYEDQQFQHRVLE